MSEKAMAWPLLAPLAAGVVDCHVVPLLVRTLPFEPGATNSGADVPLPKITLFRVSVVAPVPPLPTGSVPVTLVVRLAKVVDVVPVPPLAIGNVPETPEASRIVGLASVTAAPPPAPSVTIIAFVPVAMVTVAPEPCDIVID